MWQTTSEDWLQSVEFDKTYVRYDAVVLLNGYNPANEFWVGGGGATSCLLSRESKASARFTAQNSKTVTHVEVWPAYFFGAPFEMRSGLQEDRDGNPSGKWLGSATFTPSDIPPANRGRAYMLCPVRLELDKPVKLERGKIYHVVTQPESGKVDKQNYVDFEGVSGAVIVPRTYHGDPNMNYHDQNLMARHSDGKTWSNAYRRTPYFVVWYSDKSAEGQILVHQRDDLRENLAVGQLLRIENADKEVTQLGLMIRKQGKCRDDLHYEIRDLKEKALRKGVFKKDDIPTAFSRWSYVDFEPLILKRAETYRIVIKTPGNTRKGGGSIATDPGGFFVRGARAKAFMNNLLWPSYSSLTYGGADATFTLSYDGGKTWRKVLNKDLPFKFKLKETSVGAVTSAARDAEQVAGAGARWARIEFDGETPKGTGADILVSSSDDKATWSDFVPIKEGARSGQCYVLPAEHQKRYMRWRLALETNDAKVSPKLTQVEAVAVLRKERN